MRTAGDGLVATVAAIAAMLASIGFALLGSAPVDAQTPRFVDIVGGELQTCGILDGPVAGPDDHEVYCWGNLVGTSGTKIPRLVPGLTGARSIDVGRVHACAVLGDGTAACWGHNLQGQLGDGTQASRAAPAPVVGLSDVAEVSTGDTFSCALLGSGEVRCWGNNQAGQLGTGTAGSSWTPAPVADLDDAVGIGSGWNHTCVITSGGTLRCWGANDQHQLGDGTAVNRFAPTDVPGLSDVVAVAGGTAHTCALRADETMACVGLNPDGRLGDGTTITRSTFVDVVGIGGAAVGAVEIAAGHTHSCAVLTDGTARCWGENGLSLLGDDTRTDRTTPVAVLDLAGATAIDVGFKHTCAIVTAGTGARCWGVNIGGALGTGDTDDRSTPVDVVLSDLSTSIEGSATTVDGVGVERVTIDLFTENRDTFIDSTSTASDGTYRLDVPPGCYVLTFVAIPDTTFLDGSGFLDLARCVTEGEQLTGVDVTLIDNRSTDVTFDGQVRIEPTFDLVDGVTVDLFAAEVDGTRIQYLRSEVTRPIDGAAGSFRFEGLEPGCYTTTFIAPSGTLFRDLALDTESPWFNASRCLVAGQTATVIGRLVGSIDEGRIEVDVVDAGGAPVDGVAVDLFTAAADGTRAGYLRTVATDAGVAGFGVTPGCYVVVAIAPDDSTFTGGSPWFERGRCVGAGETVDDLIATLG